ncbi:MAG: GntR family transcriptional regulator [Veillonellaceae bacterium]|jgi:DNA-binding GntR family transcriptional regulator|nr:GntR family transcriptional regulator [Veillonellaceae bacterium]
MKLNRIPKLVSYKERVYNELKHAIINHDINPGETLNERTLANDLGISRTPIREALQLLESEGWVITEPCKGTWVKEVTLEDIDEVFQMRLALEPFAVGLAADKINESVRKALNALYAKQKRLCKEVSPLEFTDIDMDFHMYLTSLLGNHRLNQTISGLMDIMNMYIIRTIKNQARYAVAAEEHAAIIKALAEKDAVGAQQAVTFHLKQAQASIHRDFAEWKKNSHTN